LQRNEGKIEEVSLKDLKRIYEEAKKFGLNLILIGGYAVRAFTNERKLESYKRHRLYLPPSEITSAISE
jgi:hypothetical protein